jgi:hypothetical protein
LTIRNGSRIPDISTRAPNGARGVIACWLGFSIAPER